MNMNRNVGSFVCLQYVINVHDAYDFNETLNAFGRFFFLHFISP